MKTKLLPGDWLVTIPLAAVTVAYVFLVFLPCHRATGELKAQIATKQEAVQQALAMAAGLRATNQEVDKTRTFVDGWQEHSPSRGQISVLHAKIRKLADEAGTVTTKFDPQMAVNYGWLREIPLTMACTGPFARVFDFIRRLESLPETLWVDYTDLENNNTTQETVWCEINMVVFTANPENSDYVDHSE